MDKMYIDNIYKYREDYLKKKGKRIYKYELVKKSNVFGRNCYIISFNTDKNTYYKKGELYIDMQDFAVIRKVLRDNDNEISNDITFKKESDKWYLKKAEDFHNSFSTPNITEYRITLYNKIENSDLKFITLTSRDFSLQFTGKFDDNFWENNNFIPLPNWIRTQI